MGVSWEDARVYCDWLSKKTGLKFKLPTEARLEKAARGTDGCKYPWGGKEPDETLANFGGKIGKTTPVGSYPDGASHYGLLDMAGNVWEWCSDWYGSNYYKNAPKEIQRARAAAPAACYAAAVGTSTPGACAAPFAATAGPPIATSTLASAFARTINLITFTLLPFAAPASSRCLSFLMNTKP